MKEEAIMGKQEKLMDKLGTDKKVFPWNDLVTLLIQLGYEKKEMAGSRVRFITKVRTRCCCCTSLIPKTN